MSDTGKENGRARKRRKGGKGTKPEGEGGLEAFDWASLDPALTIAARFSATLDGAPKRCWRGECRRTGRCRARLDDEGDPVCDGGFSRAADERVFDLVLFLAAVADPKWR